MSSKSLIFTSLSLVLVSALAPGCKNMSDEADRTGAQLARLSRDVGAEEALNAVTEQYKRTVTPVVEKANQTVEGVEAVKAAQDAGEGAVRTVHDYGVIVINKTQRIFHGMPQTEQDLESIIDDYNRQFTGWLASNLQSIQKSGDQFRNSRTEKSYRSRLISKP